MDGEHHEIIDTTWDKLVEEAEKRMLLSALSSHLVPLSKSVPDYEVRKLRAFRRASEIAHDVITPKTASHALSMHLMEHEVWVESSDGTVGGFIDRVNRTKDGVVLSDYKSGAIMDSPKDGGSTELRQSYKAQLELYAALYHSKYGSWPIRLEIVPLQGATVDVIWDPTDAASLLAEASAFLLIVNQRIAEVQNGRAKAHTLASAQPTCCRYCLFRPGCQAYWIARERPSAEKWPLDLRGFLREVVRLRNGRLCLRIAESEPSAGTSIAVRNLTDDAHRHPALNSITLGGWVAIYGLKQDYRSGDYMETQNTVIFKAD